jgi:hypothetical protein
MKRKLFVLFLIVLGIFVLTNSECDMDSNVVSESDTSLNNQKKLSWSLVDRITDLGENSIGKETLLTEKSQYHLSEVQEAPTLQWSLEREQLSQRLKLWNDPNKIAYITLLSYGRIVAYHTIKGKVSSVNSKLTTNQQLVYNDKSISDSVCGVVESPDMDGSYGSNGDAVFFFLTDGTYVEWNEGYVLYDRPIKLSVEPLVTYEIKGDK